MRPDTLMAIIAVSILTTGYWALCKWLQSR
ncbi:hypothetical protein BBOR36S_02467 [Brevibacillus borstelensis]